MGLSERNIIDRIAEQQSAVAPDLLMGIGDDCAVVKKTGELVQLWTTDTLVQGVHFDCRWHPPHLLGRKAAGANISDIGAMGGRPRFALLSLGLTADCDEQWLDGFMAGFLSALDEHDMVLVGGDTVYCGERIMVSVTVCGEMYDKKVCYRSAAKAGDQVWVSGFLGDAACGLELCRKGLHDQPEYASLVAAHLDPQPQPVLGQALADSGCVRAMMDLSDGLATDLAHICKASGVGAKIDADLVPLSAALQKGAEMVGMSPLKLALSGGEDYQLVFTADPAQGKKLQKVAQSVGCDVHCLGRLVEGGGVVLCQGDGRRDIGFKGYEHTF